MNLKPLLIIKTGHAPQVLIRKFGDFEDWIIDRCGSSAEFFQVWNAQKMLPFPDLSGVNGIIITGSLSMVTERLTWSERLADWLPQVAEMGIQIFGICYGHQLLAHAFGGKIGYNPNGPEIGTVQVNTADSVNDKLFQYLPKQFPAQASHRQSVIQPPPGARILASTDKDRIQAFTLNGNVRGVQFHPEFNAAIMRGFIEYSDSEIKQNGFDFGVLKTSVTETPAATQLLVRFYQMVKNSSDAR